MSAVRPFRRRIFLNTGATFLGNGWAMVVSLVTLPLLLKGLGPTAFGLWALLQTFSAINGWFSLVHAGLGTAATRAVAHSGARDDKAGESAALGTALALFVACGVVAGGLLALVGPPLLPRLFHAGELDAALRAAVLLFAVQVFLDVLAEGVESCLEGLQRVDLSRLVDAVRRTAVGVATASVALSGAGLVGVAAASLAASTTGPVAAFLLLLLLRHRFRTSPQMARSLLITASSVAALRPLGVLERTMDRLIVGIALGPASVTIVEIATQVANGASAILSASAYAVVPTSSWLQGRNDRHRLRELLDRGTRYSMLVTLPVVVGVAIVITPALHLWVGSRYSDAALPAVLALVTIAQVAPLQVGSELLLGTGHTWNIFRAASATMVVNLVGSILLVYLIGIPGTFVATLIAGLVLTFLLARSFLAEVGETAGEFLRNVVSRCLRPSLVLGAVAGFIVALRLPDMTTVALVAAVGGVACIAFTLSHSLERAELTELRAVALGQ
jgi:O-antigen/teichoic acid export membrane protein